MADPSWYSAIHMTTSWGSLQSKTLAQINAILASRNLPNAYVHYTPPSGTWKIPKLNEFGLYWGFWVSNPGSGNWMGSKTACLQWATMACLAARAFCANCAIMFAESAAGAVTGHPPHAFNVVMVEKPDTSIAPWLFEPQTGFFPSAAMEILDGTDTTKYPPEAYQSYCIVGLRIP